MYSKELEEVIEAALADGVITDVERKVLYKRALAEGVDSDELDVVIEGRLAKMKKQEDWLRPAPPKNLANEKHGNVVKCPSCGAQVIGGSAICQECGYTFANISANSSIEKLQTKLDEFNQRQEQRADNRGFTSSIMHGISKGFGTDKTFKHKMDIVKNFPVPNTRGDLLEFLTAIRSMVNSTGSRLGGNPSSGEEDLSYAYWLLYSNCINKARLSFSKDSDFSEYFAFYEKELMKTKGIIGYIKCHPNVQVVLGLMVFIIFDLLLLFLLLK